MYKINDTVIYGTEGICSVIDIAERTFGGKTDVYYILRPLYKNGSTVMLPMSNTALVSRLKKLLTPEEVKELIANIKNETGAEWIDNEKLRKENYRSVIMNGDRTELVRHIKRLYERTEEQKLIGKKLHACDERFLEDAQRILHDEFSVVLGIPRDEVLAFIRDHAGLDKEA